MTLHPEIDPCSMRVDIVAMLSGRWSFQRTIERQGAMQGTAAFVPSPSGQLQYHEEGRLRLTGGAEFESERDYLFERVEGGFAVFFSESPCRLFHEVRLQWQNGQLIGKGDHRCGDDLYRTTYRFFPDGRFVIEHDVDGPRKGYRIITSYERL